MNDGTVYFIRDSVTGQIKIGVAGKPWRRLSKIQTDCPGEVSILALEPGGAEREAALHREFAAARVRGEWFRAVPGLLQHIATLPAPAKPKARPIAHEVIAKCGGNLRVADWLGLDRSCVQRWGYPPPRGTGGQIPAKYWAPLILAARAEGIELSLESLFPPGLAETMRAAA